MYKYPVLIIHIAYRRITMTVLLKIICAIALFGMVHSWNLSSQKDANSTLFSILNDMDRIMVMMNQRFQRLFNISSSPAADRQQLDAVEPICTNTTTTTTGSVHKNRRRNFRPTHTITCTKELIQNGRKQLYKEVNITNDKGVLISRSKMYQTILINPQNNTAPIDRNVRT